MALVTSPRSTSSGSTPKNGSPPARSREALIALELTGRISCLINSGVSWNSSDHNLVD